MKKINLICQTIRNEFNLLNHVRPQAWGGHPPSVLTLQGSGEPRGVLGGDVEEAGLGVQLPESLQGQGLVGDNLSALTLHSHCPEDGDDGDGVEDD